MCELTLNSLFGFCFQEIAKIAHAQGALLIVDNSIMSPILSKPLDLGAGMVLETI